MKKILLSTLAISAFISYAAEYEVKMLSWGKEGPMVFEPAILQISVGDTVTFLPTQAGHQVDSLVVPDGAEKLHSELDETYMVTLDKEGVYLYTCLPHRTMNMSGLIQVGKPLNRDALDVPIKDLESRVVMNAGRLTGYLAQLDKLNSSQVSQVDETSDVPNQTDDDTSSDKISTD